MAKFIDITDWSEKLYFQPGGTRSKVVVENPDNGENYFFKTSLKREQKDYKHEFWSEIIASEVGIILGFDMLVYDIAYNGGEIGCLSKSMIDENKNQLTEGISYLKGFDTTYNPESKESKKEYSFHFILEALETFGLDIFIKNIIEVIIIDSIIGNGDRHQENWGIITEYNEVIKILKKEQKSFFSTILFFLLAILTRTKNEEVKDFAEKLLLFIPGKFSQIYDSGSCLGRELRDEKIEQMIRDDNMIESYIRKGVSEIHWQGQKLNHFELIRNINKFYPDTVKAIIDRVKKKYNQQEIVNCVQNIDKYLPNKLRNHELPQERKQLIIKLINLRAQKLFEIKS